MQQVRPSIPIADGFVGVAIQPATITDVKTVTQFVTNVVSLDLFKSVTVAVTLMNEAGQTVANRSFVIEGAEYLAWNNDDQYLVDLVASKLGFTLA
jgi:hypothetical protein